MAKTNERRWIKVRFFITFMDQEIEVERTISTPLCTKDYSEEKWGYLQRKCDQALVDGIVDYNLNCQSRIEEVLWGPDEHGRLLPAVSDSDASTPSSST